MSQLVNIRGARRKAHEIISRIGLLGLQVVAKRENELLKLLDAIFSIHLVLPCCLDLRSSLILSLLLNSDGLLQDSILIHNPVVLSLQIRKRGFQV